MSKPIRVQVSALSGRIYAGRINTAGTEWAGEKHDVTSDVVGAIIEKIGAGHVLRVTRNDGTAFDIEVRSITSSAGEVKPSNDWDFKNGDTY